MNTVQTAIGVVFLLGVAAYLFMTTPATTLQFQNQQLLSQFEQYQTKYNKHYSSKAEANYRLAIFQMNLEQINRINSDNTKTYKAGVNQFTDMTQAELVEKILMKPLPPTTMQADASAFSNIKAANDVDWRQKTGVVTPVKNQGSCGSCWSFSTTGLLEGHAALHASQPGSSFSEQQLVDCCGADGYQCQGCGGAWPEWALNWVKDHGITTESEYPYVGVDQSCSKDSGEFKDLTSYTMLPQNDEDTLKKANTVQPISICVDAMTWFNYQSGIFNDCPSSPSLDHAVLLVGYVEGQYYIVKNSWDTTWGEQGFIRLPANGSNPCGIAMHAISTIQ